MVCSVCPCKCFVDRAKKVGLCGVDSLIRVARAAPHFWEEPCISASNGSGTVFFSGCSLRCVFCQNYEVSHAAFGKPLSAEQLMRAFDSLVARGVHNLNLVTPTHYTRELAEILREYKAPVPVVWNSSGYESVESLRLLEGLVDIYLPDLKYYDSSVSQKYSGAADYFEVASRAITEMARQVGGLETDENGVAKKGLLIRHLVLPGNVSQTYKVFGWIAEKLSVGTAVSLMRQYTPFGKAKTMPPLNRPLSAREYSMARRRVLELGFENCFFQQSESASSIYIPPFDLEGLDL